MNFDRELPGIKRPLLFFLYYSSNLGNSCITNPSWKLSTMPHVARAMPKTFPRAFPRMFYEPIRRELWKHQTQCMVGNFYRLSHITAKCQRIERLVNVVFIQELRIQATSVLPCLEEWYKQCGRPTTTHDSSQGFLLNSAIVQICLQFLPVSKFLSIKIWLLLWI